MICIILIRGSVAKRERGERQEEFRAEEEINDNEFRI
jgi:hypothetical protein